MRIERCARAAEPETSKEDAVSRASTGLGHDESIVDGFEFRVGSVNLARGMLSAAWAWKDARMKS